MRDRPALNTSKMSAAKQRGAGMMIYDGSSDPVFFSSDYTTAWMQITELLTRELVSP